MYPEHENFIGFECATAFPHWQHPMICVEMFCFRDQISIDEHIAFRAADDKTTDDANKGFRSRGLQWQITPR